MITLACIRIQALLETGMTKLRRYQLPSDDWVPNNPRLPVRLYRNALEPETTRCAEAFEGLFLSNGWRPEWRGRIHADHQYHSTAHEVIGFARGSGILMIGGPHGKKIAVDACDAVLLPVGTGHCMISESWDFRAVGAYPIGEAWDVRRTAPSKDELGRIASLPLPPRDPVLGYLLG